MILYLFTSALAKITSKKGEALTSGKKADEAEGIATSRIAYAEARAAFARKRREHGLSRKGYRLVVEDLNQDRDDYFILDVSDGVVKSAGILAERHDLRGADAIHLASALALGKRSDSNVMFFCFDGRLTFAARKGGLGTAS